MSYIKKPLFCIIASFLLLIFIASCNNDDDNEAFNVKAFLRDQVNDLILPTLDEFVLEANTLQTSINTFANTPTEANLTAARNQWRTTTLAYEKTYTYHIGEAREIFLHSAIYNWPITTGVIEFMIEDNDVITQEIINSLSPRSKSIAAIEYLLYKSDLAATNAEFINSQQRRDYLKLCANNLVAQSERLQNIWLPTGQNYANAFINNSATGIDGSFNLFFNGLNNLIDTNKVTKIGKPAGLENSQVINPELTQAFFSRTSLDIVAINIQTLKNTYFNSQGLGVDDYVFAITGNNNLNNSVESKIDEVQTAINTIQIPLYEAVTSNHELVENLHIKLEELRVLFSVDLQSILSIVITTTDNDGD